MGPTLGCTLGGISVRPAPITRDTAARQPRTCGRSDACASLPPWLPPFRGGTGACAELTLSTGVIGCCCCGGCCGCGCVGCGCGGCCGCCTGAVTGSLPLARARPSTRRARGPTSNSLLPLSLRLLGAPPVCPPPETVAAPVAAAAAAAAGARALPSGCSSALRASSATS